MLRWRRSVNKRLPKIDVVKLAKQLDPFPWRGTPIEWVRRIRGYDVFIVQIGAHCSLDDPLRRLAVSRDWSGLLVEPVPELAAQLKRNYADYPGFSIAEVLIGEATGFVPFYRVHDETRLLAGLPDWFNQIGSVDPQHIAKHVMYLEASRHDHAKQMTTVEDLPCVSMENLFTNRQVRKVDVLQIDTEGSDYKVLRQFDFQRYRPQVVIYEHRHLPEDQKVAARDLLQANGYEIKDYQFDTLGWRAHR